MTVQHDPPLLADFPQLTVGTIMIDGVDTLTTTPEAAQVFLRRASSRLEEHPESTWPAVMAWRRAFSALGLKPTQYRCASESLLRRLRTTGSLPAIHPLVDLCNAASAAYGIPIAVFDRDAVVGNLTVRRATGTEQYLAFDGTVEHPEPGEVVFADDGGHAHSRRWSHRQSARSSVQPSTRSVLIVIEAMHENGDGDVAALVGELSDAMPENVVVVSR